MYTCGKYDINFDYFTTFPQRSIRTKEAKWSRYQGTTQRGWLLVWNRLQWIYFWMKYILKYSLEVYSVSTNDWYRVTWITLIMNVIANCYFALLFTLIILFLAFWRLLKLDVSNKQYKTVIFKIQSINQFL